MGWYHLRVIAVQCSAVSPIAVAGVSRINGDESVVVAVTFAGNRETAIGIVNSIGEGISNILL